MAVSIWTILLLSMCATDITSLRINTTSGIMDGAVKFGIGIYLGIPYAEPPVETKRFSEPELKSRVVGVYNATFYRPRCPQLTPKNDTSEDCLFLNIFAPIAVSNSLRAVMVFVHGGSYLFGAGDSHDGTLIAIYQDVVVVNINYRLGALGFLSTQDENAGGNFGLWDQTMALRWIKLNIAAFGGNAYDVTIFGESAGAGSVTQLSLSPFTEGLFNRVIAESGTAFAPWSHNDDCINAALSLGRRLGCPTDSNKGLVACLRTISANDIVKNQHSIQPGNAFSPSYGTKFLPYTPQELITTHSSTKTARRLAALDILLGINVDDGGFFYTGFLGTLRINGTNGLPKEAFDKAVLTSTQPIANENPHLVEKLIAPLTFMYTDWANLNDNIARARQLVQLLGDASFIAPTVQFARGSASLRQKWALSPTKRTYLYLYKHRGSWMSKEPWRIGADHTDELPFVFGFPLSGFLPASKEEKDFSLQMMAYWANFAKTGNPNSVTPNTQPTEWPVFDLGTEQYIELDLGMNRQSTGQYLFNDRAAFWLDYFPAQMNIFKSEPYASKC